MNCGPRLGVIEAGAELDTRVRHAIDRIEEQLHRPLTTEELARSAGLSVAQFTRLFRQATGTTPGVFLRRLRLARARLLIERTALSVADVMAQVGVTDRSHFARDFRSAHGFSPRMLRMHLRARDRGRRSG